MSTYLKVSTTALMLRALERNPGGGRSVSLSDPLRALNQVSQDLSFRQPLALENGQRWTALQIQLHYWILTGEMILDGEAPPWGMDAWERWGSILDRLEEGARPPQARESLPLSRALDAHIKFALYSRYLQRRGMGWPQVQSDPDLYRSLCLLDVRYGQLGGLFDQLEEKGVLEHRIVVPEEIEAALAHPPADTRAALRGSWIQKICQEGNGAHYLCTWMGIADLCGGRSLDLRDPFCTRADWGDPLGGPEEAEGRLREHLRAVRRPRGRPVID